MTFIQTQAKANVKRYENANRTGFISFNTGKTPIDNPYDVYEEEDLYSCWESGFSEAKYMYEC